MAPVDPLAQRLIGFAGAIIVAFILGYGLRSCTHTCPTVPQVAASSIDVRTDTIIKVVEHGPIYIRGKAKVTREHLRDDLSLAIPVDGTTLSRNSEGQSSDTSLQALATESRVATLDTIVNKDTIGVRYSYRDESFYLAFRRAADSVKVEYRTVTLTHTTHEKREWWIDMLTHLGAATVGFGIGSIK